MPSFGDKLRELREARRMTLEDLAAASGLNPSTVWKAENAYGQVRGSTYRKLATAFGMTPAELDRQWRSDRVPQRNPGGGIPVFDEVPAGEGDFDPTSLGEDEGVASWYIPRQITGGLDDPLAYAVKVKGDSMSPDFVEGDIVVCSPAAQHESHMVAVFRLDDGETGIKLIEAVGDDELLLVPRNPIYPPKRVHRERVVRLARVVWQGRATAPAVDRT